MKLAGVAVFCLPPSGPRRSRPRLRLPRGEVLLAGALDALEKSVAFVKGTTR